MFCTVDSAKASIFCPVLFCVLLPQGVTTWLFDDLTVNNKRLLAQSKTGGYRHLRNESKVALQDWPMATFDVLMFSIVKCLRDLQDKLPYLVVLSLYLSLFWQLRDKRNFKKNCSFDPNVSTSCQNIVILNVYMATYVAHMIFPAY